MRYWSVVQLEKGERREGLWMVLRVGWVPLETIGSIYIGPNVHLGIQLQRNHWFYKSEGGSRNVRGAFESNPELISADSCSEIIGFKGCLWGPLEALWGPVEALGSTYMDP